MRWRTRSLTAALAAVLVLACTGDGPDEGDPAETDAPPDPATILEEDRDAPPEELVVEDRVVGDGQLALVGTAVEVHLGGLRWSDGAEVVWTWAAGQPYGFELSDGRTIEGVEAGIEGMRVGGRRVLTVPPDLAYGEEGAGDVVGPDETLVFVVDLVAVDPDPDPPEPSDEVPGTEDA